MKATPVFSMWADLVGVQGTEEGGEGQNIMPSNPRRNYFLTVPYDLYMNLIVLCEMLRAL